MIHKNANEKGNERVFYGELFKQSRVNDIIAVLLQAWFKGSL